MLKTRDIPRYHNTYFLLLHSKHYYGVQDVKKVFGARNYCGLCQMSHCHSYVCRSQCQLCLSLG